MIPLGSGRTALDVGARYFSSDRVSLLTKGDLRDDGNGGVTFTPRRADGNVVEFRLGITCFVEQFPRGTGTLAAYG